MAWRVSCAVLWATAMFDRPTAKVITTSAKNDEQGRALLEAFAFPFRK